MPNKTVYEGGDDFKDADVDAPPKSKQDKQVDNPTQILCINAIWCLLSEKRRS